MTKRALVPGIVLFSLVGCGEGVPQIKRASVERVITTLASDEMLGRAPFTPSIDKAAEFIRDEFASIGLEPIPGMDGYLQHFGIYRMEVQDRSVVLNGVEIPGDRTFAWTEAASVHWTTDDPVDVFVIGPEEDAGQRIYEIRTSRREAIVLMSTAHEEFFRRWSSEWSGSYFFLDWPQGPTLFCALTDETMAGSYEFGFTATVEELPLTNVVGMIPGKRPDEIVLFGGHYDGYGIREPVAGDSIANAANDCASGTTGVIELARYFKAVGRPERTLMFAAFTAEEIGFQGSEYLARHIDPDKIVTMFSIAAIGKVDPRGGPGHAHITGFERSDLGPTLQRALEGTPYDFYPDPYEGRYLFRRSDNAPFARLGVPAHAIATIGMDPQDEDLHQVSDEIEHLDLDNMTEIIRAIAIAFRGIIAGEATPTRLDPPLQD